MKNRGEGKDKMNNKLGGITGLRGITACLIAYIYHYLLLFQAMPANSHLGTQILGAMGFMLLSASDVFFVMSGFLMARKYENRQIEPFREYIFKRISKIYPLMIVTAIWAFAEENIGLHLLGYYPLHGDGGEVRYSLIALLLNVFGLQTGFVADGDTYAVNGPSWFVSVIITCQILFYIILRYVKSRRKQNLIFAGMILVGVLAILYPVNVPLLYSCMARGYLGFGIGVLMCRGTSGIYENNQEYREYIRQASSVVALLISQVLLYVILSGREHVVLNELFIQLTGFWACLTFMSVYGFVTSRILGLKIFKWLGDRAMTIFLCNLPTDIGIALVDKYWNLNIEYASIEIWLLHIVISMVIVVVVYELEKTLKNAVKKVLCQRKIS